LPPRTVRRPAVRVLVGEVVNNPVELPLEVQGVERDVQLVRDPPGVASVVAEQQPRARE